MDPKTISIGAIAVAALTVSTVNLVTSKPTTQLSVVAGGTVIDEAVTEIAKGKVEVSERNCELQRCQLDSTEITLCWICDGAAVSAKTQAELSKMAGEEGVAIKLTPRLDGEKVVFDSLVTRGTKPNTDPVPVVEEKPLEDLKTP
jgi:hypothetical protein